MVSALVDVELDAQVPGGEPAALRAGATRSPRVQFARAILLAIATLAGSLLLQLVVLGDLQQRSAQQRLFDDLRGDLAAGTAPTGAVDLDGRAVGIGAPMAYLEIPAIGLRQVIVEGTTPGALLEGPGHRRDSPFPGHAGTSVVFGRRAAFGGPFARLGELERGDRIKVTTGQGAFDFEVLGVRAEGDPVPDAVRSGSGRLVLTTAGGRAFVPSGVIRVDADLDGAAVAGVRPIVQPGGLPASEQVMATDTSTLWALALWLQALMLLAGGAVWGWLRLGRARTWTIFLPPCLLVGLAAAGEVTRVLPNLL